MRIGIFLGATGEEPAGIDAVVAQAQRAEAAGLASVWFSNIFAFDAMTLAAVCGRATERIELGTAVVPTYFRHPVAMAQQALSTQAATGGRFALGVGLSHQVVVEGMLGTSFARPYSHMREYLAVLAPLIRSGRVRYAGAEFRVTAALTVPGAAPCPILLAALGPRMLALAGSVADGTVTWMTGPRTLQERTLPAIIAAAAEAGRPPPRIVAGFPVAVTDDPATAQAAAARIFRIYGTLPSYRAMLDAEGAAGPADVALIGDEAAVTTRVAALRAIGVTDFVAAPFPSGPEPAATVARTLALLGRLATDGA